MIGLTLSMFCLGGKSSQQTTGLLRTVFPGVKISSVRKTCSTNRAESCQFQIVQEKHAMVLCRKFHLVLLTFKDNSERHGE